MEFWYALIGIIAPVMVSWKQARKQFAKLEHNGTNYRRYAYVQKKSDIVIFKKAEYC